jgi:branched-chain amino acid transport system permease protein
MMADIGIWLQVLLWGLYAGCIYILLATGLTLIFGVMKIVNFAHGEFLMLGAFFSFWAVNILNLNPYLAIPLAMTIMAAVGVLTERICFRPILGTSKLNEIIVSLGLIMIFQNMVAHVWGNDGKSIKSPYEKITFPVGSVNIPLDYVIIIIVTILVLLGLHFFLNRTSIGRAMRATSQNRDAAKLVGINVERMDMLSFGIGSSLAALGGGLWAVSGQVFDYQSGSIPAIKAFAIIILGGLGSIQGAVAGGLIYGIIESIAAYLIGAAWKDATSFLILIIVLVIRPSGIFGGVEE